MTQFSATMPSISAPTRDAYNFDRAYGRTLVSPTAPNTRAPTSKVKLSPADEDVTPGPQAPSQLGYDADRRSDANNYAHAAFNNHWQERTKGLDMNNNDAVEALAKAHGVSRGQVAPMSITSGNGNYTHESGYHTMTNDELLAATKSRAREQFHANLTTGQPMPPSPAPPAAPMGTALAPAPQLGPQAGSGVAHGSPVGSYPSADVQQGYQNTAAGLMPSQAPAIARRTGLQPYDVQEQQTAVAGGKANLAGQQALVAAIPGQVAAQNAAMGAQTAAQTAQAGHLTAESQTLVPAQAKEAEGRAAQAQGAGALSQAQATGAVPRDQHQKALDDLTTKHQQEIAALNAKLAGSQEQLRIARKGGQDMGPGGETASDTGDTAPAAPASPQQASQPADGAARTSSLLGTAGANGQFNAVVRSGTLPDGRRVHQLADGSVVDQYGRPVETGQQLAGTK